MKPRKKYQVGRFGLLLSLVCLGLVFGLPCFSVAADIYVDDDTCPSNGSGTASDPYCSIGDAIYAASNGDDVLVYPGTYSERIYMKTGVDVRRAETTKPVITPSFKTMVKFYGANDCALDGFVLDGTGGQGRFAMIRVASSSTNVTISNCEIKGGPNPASTYFRTGILLSGQVSINITGNTIYNTYYSGITTRSSKWGSTINNSTVTIQGNTIEGNGRCGIYLAGATGYTNQVIIGGSGAGEGNFISGNGAGATKGSGIRLNNITQVSMENNTIQNNRRAGILLIDTSSVSPHITGNIIHDNTESGFNIGGASALIIGAGNEIYSNGISGISFFVSANTLLTGSASSQPVLITGNSIYGNTKAGIAVLDQVTGTITIDGNTIHQNTRSGISFFKTCTASITDNDIYDHSGAAGIFTGDWSGTYPPDPDNPPTRVAFDRSAGPVNLTIRRNKIHGNLAGMRLDHASGVITNNLVYKNTKSGIRYAGDNSSPYDPFGASWGITEIRNNTVVDNGSNDEGGGIVYDDINTTTDADGNPRTFDSRPLRESTQTARTIKNNITAYNVKAGIRDAVCGAARDYNLFYGNFGLFTAAPAQAGGCWKNDNELFSDPLFADRAAEDYSLQAGSPAEGSGDDGFDMGAFGGSDPITW